MMLMAGCGGGGGFDNPAVIVVGADPKPINNPKTPPEPDPAPPTLDDPKNSALTAPTLASAMPFVKRNLRFVYQDGKGKHLEEYVAINPEDMTADTPQNLAKKLKEAYPDTPLYETNHDGYQHVKAGWIFGALYPRQYLRGDETNYVKGDGYLYYHGQNPATANLKGKLSYVGHWDFMTDVKRVRDYDHEKQGFGGGTAYGMDDRFGNEISATSFAEQVFGQTTPRQGNHLAKFEVDFDDKTLTGTLSTKKQATKNETPSYLERYRLNATIKGNRFMGSAKASNPNGEFNLFSKDATGRLEGGFFGSQGEELLGKFLTDDNSVFGVFAGKSDHDKVFETKYDGVYLELTQDKALNPSEQSQRLALASFGNVNQLYLNGRLIELLPLQKDKPIRQVFSHDDQTVSISSFGTADGMLRLGLIQRTATQNQSNNAPSDEDIKKAQEALQAHIDDQKQNLEELLGEYMEAGDNPSLKSRIITQALLGYADPQKAEAKARLEKLLDKLSDDPEDFEAFLAVVALFEGGAKFNLDDNANLQSYLSKETAPKPTHTQAQIATAKQRLSEALSEAKDELFGLLAGYLDADEDEKQDIAQDISDKIAEAYTTDILDRVQEVLDELSSDDQDTQAKAKQALMALLEKGDKFDGNNLDNLKAYLPALPDIITTPLTVDNSLSGLYLLGVRTDTDKMPKEGVANYHGTWHGKIGHHWQSEAGYGNYDGKAKFRVNFADKTLTGALVEKNGIESAFNIDAKIQGNEFYGTAVSRTTGINLDAGRQQNQQILPATVSNNLQGAFYGDNAKHLGGSFSFENTLQNSQETVIGGAVFYGTKE